MSKATLSIDSKPLGTKLLPLVFIVFALIIIVVSRPDSITAFAISSGFLFLAGYFLFYQPEKIFRFNSGFYFFVAMWVINWLLYYPVLSYGFFSWDDPVSVQQNPLLRNFVLTDALFSAARGMYQPLVDFSFYLDYQLSGLNPARFHASNLYLHLLNGLVLMQLFLRLKFKPWVVLATSYFFLFHVVQVEPIIWVSSRKDLLYSFFYLMAILFYLKKEESDSNRQTQIFLALVYFFFFLSLLSKPQAVTLPLVLILIDYYRNPSFDRRNSFFTKFPLFILSLLFGSLVFYFSRGESPDLLVVDRLVLSIYALLYYLLNPILPFELSIFYAFPQHLNSIHYLSLLLIPVIGFILYRYRTNRILVIIVFYILIQLFFLLPIFPNSFIFKANRYFYLLIPFLFLIMVQGVFKYAYSVRFYILFVPLTFVISLTSKQVKEWEHPITLWNKVVASNPHSDVAFNNHAYSHYLQGNFEIALKSYKRSIQIAPNRYEAYAGRGAIFTDLGEYENALNDLNRVLTIYPDHAISYYNRALVFQYLGEFAAAMKDFNQSLKLDSNQPRAYLSRGALKINMGDFTSALNDLNVSIEQDPDNYLAYSNRGLAHVRLNQINQAELDFSTTISLNPNFSDAYSNRGMIYFNRGEYGKSITDFNYAIKYSPTMFIALHNRGRAYLMIGNSRMACKDFAAAAQLGFEPAQKEFTANCSSAR